VDGITVSVGSDNKVHLSATPFAFADGEAGHGDADPAIADVTSTITIDESGGKITVRCGQAASSHGTAATGTTGCDAFTVQVPAGSATAPHTLTVTAGGGGVNVSGLTGSVNAHGENGDAEVSVTPATGSVIVVTGDNGNAKLHLPASFAADSITLSATNGNIVTTDFPDVHSGSGHGSAGTGAKSITVTAGNGDASLVKQ
jgi:hypothetical protein